MLNVDGLQNLFVFFEAHSKQVDVVNEGGGGGGVGVTGVGGVAGVVVFVVPVCAFTTAAINII
jgi:hypothetical protein